VHKTSHVGTTAIIINIELFILHIVTFTETCQPIATSNLNG